MSPFHRKFIFNFQIKHSIFFSNFTEDDNDPGLPILPDHEAPAGEQNRGNNTYSCF